VKCNGVWGRRTKNVDPQIASSRRCARKVCGLPGSRIRFGLLLAFLLSISSFAFSQGITTGAISGTVQDPQGAVVHGAKITVVSAATNVTSTDVAGANGTYALRNLPVGVYTVTVESAGFAPLKVPGVIVMAGNESSLGVQQLVLGNTEVVVEVDAAAPVIEATTSQITSEFGTRQIADLPVGNGFDSLALLAPGVVNTGDGRFSNSNGAGLSVNGQRGRSNNFEIDGQNNNDNSIGGPAFFFGNQDALQEVDVITNNFSAEYGRNLGSVVNYITKSGTNKYHGTAYEFYNGSFINSLHNQDKSPLLVNSPTQPRTVDNRWGATLGGPVKKDKFWLFGSTNYERQRDGVSPASSGSALTPTPAGVAALQTAFPNNPAVIGLSQFGPFGIREGNPSVLGTPVTIPVSNGTTIVPVPFAAVQRLVPALNDDKEVTGRADYQIGNSDHIFGRYLYQSTLTSGALNNTSAVIARGANIVTSGRNQDVGIDWARDWTNNFVNQVRVSYFRENLGFEGGAVPTCLRANLNSCPTNITFPGTNAFSLGYATNNPQGRLVNNTEYQDNATWAHGKHTIKFGGEYQRQRSPNVFLPNVNGQFLFGRSATTPAFLASSGLSTTNQRIGDAFSNFLQDTGTLNLADGPPQFNFKEQDLAFYGQDDWKITSNLTLNLGLRWEFTSQAINELHDLTVARESNPATAFFNTSLPLSRRTIPNIPQDQHNFGPNIGFAYSPNIGGAGKTVIRGGYRINYEPEFYNIFLNVATAAPVVNLGTINCGPGANSCLSSAGFLGNAIRAQDLAFLPRGGDPNARNQTGVSSNFHNPYGQNYTLGIQREINSKIVGEIRYVGNHTIGNFQTLDSNPQLSALAAAFPRFVPVPLCGPGSPGFSPTAPGIGRPDCTQSNVRTRANTAFSIYNGLQSQLQFRDFHGVTGGLSYTYSRTISNADEIFSTGGAGGTVAGSADPFNTNQLERTVAGISRTNVTSVYFNYLLPVHASQSGLFGRLAGGWQLNMVYEFASGAPYSLDQGTADGSLCDNSFNGAFFGVDTCRPFLTPGANPNLPQSYVVNSAAAARTFGNPFGIPRNTLRGQSTNNVDLGIFKNVKVREGMTLQLQANAANILNRQFRGTPNPNIDAYTASPTNPSVPAFNNSFLNNSFNSSNNRQITLGAKFIF
jgi:outer membrane receptor protein involved in Fe transport